MTPDEALAAIDEVTALQVRELAGRLFCDEALRLAVVAPAGKGRGLESTLRLPGGPAAVQPRRPRVPADTAPGAAGVAASTVAGVAGSKGAGA